MPTAGVRNQAIVAAGSDRKRRFPSDLSRGLIKDTSNRVLSGLAGVLGVPYTRNRQYAGATAGDGPAELSKPTERR